MIETFWNICLLHDISSRDQLLREAVRVVQTRKMLEQQGAAHATVLEPEVLFRWMKDHIGKRELGHFPGDRELFYRLYQAGKDIDLLDYALQTLQQDRVTGVFIVHSGIMERFEAMCSRNNYRSLLITETEKYLRGLVETRLYKQSFTITLLTESYIIAKLLKTYFEPYPNVQVIQGSIYHPLPLTEKFNAILTIPNFGLKMVEDDDTTIRDSEGVAVNHLLPLLQEGGRISVTFPARMMFQSGGIAKWREQTNELYPVQSVHMLPDGLFRPYTSVKTYQIEFGNSPTEEVLLGRLQLQKMSLAIEGEITIHSDAFGKLDNWRIDMLLNEDQETLCAFQQAHVPKVKLQDIADIFRGKSILKQDLRAGNIKVLNISNLEDGDISLKQLETIDEEERKVKRYEILPGDLVMACRGTVNKLAIFPESEGTVIASANIIVIRFKSSILSGFAKIFLESPVGMTLIQSFQRGTTVMNLNPSDVAEIELPLLSIEEQMDRIKRYVEEKERFKAAVRDATARWEQVRNKLYNELY
ncbi:restriction endonuclease subunit S [Paenibacillus sp. Soil522]|uniref:restriction endonuclease subunit S n=1 Tax=Paenibacillus sp. Soil522 TaxID=1736388 RepID=UPI0006F8AAD2|nr:restriction endonuclease subunit S [Paenibacillus sp. Soil522]KRE45511.1 restriction endonuclease subunit S [Paenibacillus sp. Soil522]